MLALAARLIGGVFTPLIDQASTSSARLLRKLALFVVAAIALVVVLIALTIAFDLWVTSMRGPIAGALAVAAVYFVIAAAAVLVALFTGAPKTAADARQSAATAAKGGLDAHIDEFAAPLLAVLRRLGLRKEQLAVLAGTSVAKQIGPLPLVGLAIVGGFLIGRMWRGLFSTDAIASLLASDLLAGLFTAKTDADDPSSDDERDAA